MELVQVSTENAPKPIGPYSQAVKVGELIYCAGQIPLEPSGNHIRGSSVGEQTEQCLLNLSEVLKAAGSSLDKVVKTTVFLKQLADFPKMNESYAKFFSRNFPARTTVEVNRLPRDALVEIEAVAVV